MLRGERTARLYAAARKHVCPVIGRREHESEGNSRVSGALGLGLLITLTVALVLVVFPSRGQSGISPAPGGIARVTSAYSVDESSTTGTQTLWSRSLQIPNSYRTLYVTLTGQSDVHSSAHELLGCQVDGTARRPSG
jgi:hypothetical protein